MPHVAQALNLEIPALAGSRHRVAVMLSDVPEDLTGTIVRLGCSGLIASTRSFTDELIVELVARRRCESVRVDGRANTEFREFVAEAAAAHAVQDRVTIDRR